jgi:hypothetical protein
MRQSGLNLLVVAAALALGGGVQTACLERPAAPETPAADRRGPPAGARLLFTWEGRVDGRDVLKFRGDRCLVEHEQLREIEEMKFRSFHPLDPWVFPVIVVREAGRGKVDIIRQGDRWNGFTLMVRVDDLEVGGADRLRFSAHQGKAERGVPPVLSVYAEVDDETWLEIAGAVLVARPAGVAGVRDLKYVFHDSAGLEAGAAYRLRRIHGRGEAELEGDGSRGRPFRIHVRDKAAGSSVYVLEVYPGGRD